MTRCRRLTQPLGVNSAARSSASRARFESLQPGAAAEAAPLRAFPLAVRAFRRARGFAERARRPSLFAFPVAPRAETRPRAFAEFALLVVEFPTAGALRALLGTAGRTRGAGFRLGGLAATVPAPHLSVFALDTVFLAFSVTVHALLRQPHPPPAGESRDDTHQKQHTDPGLHTRHFWLPRGASWNESYDVGRPGFPLRTRTGLSRSVQREQSLRGSNKVRISVARCDTVTC